MDETCRDWFSGIFSPQPGDPHDLPLQVAPNPLHETQTPPVPSSIVSRASTPTESSAAITGRARPYRKKRAEPPKLRVLRLEEWDRDKSYNDDPATCLHYSIEWSATLDGKEVLRDTEPDLVLNPAAHWQLFLERRVESLVRKELGVNNSPKPDHVMVVVSVTGRSERKLVKRFEADIDWQLVENHLTQWSDLFQSGKKLRVDITFHFSQAVQQPISATSNNGGRKGRSSATQRMRTRRHNQLHAEEESTGDPVTWSRVYRIMRCPSACPKGPHCFVDPISGRHFKMFPHHLEDLISRIENLNLKFESQDDVPDDIRRQLFAEEQQRRDSSHSKTAKSSAGMTPITINNHFPEHAQFSSGPVPPDDPIDPNNPNKVSRSVCATESLDIPSPLDQAVREYSEWQKSRVSDASYKVDVDKARDVVLDQCRDLRQIHDDQDSTFLEEAGVCIGTAKRYVSGIPVWVKRRRCEA